MAKLRVIASAPVLLDPATTDIGAMERLFIVETRSPAVPGFIAVQNLAAMRMMRQVIVNRLKAPGHYQAPGARTPTDIIEMGNQFAGFGGYPDLDATMLHNIDEAVRIAANPRHPQQAEFARYVRDAITAATEPVMPLKAEHADVTAWRTAGASAPGKGFVKLETLSGNTFYATSPVPPMPAGRRRHGDR